MNSHSVQDGMFSNVSSFLTAPSAGPDSTVSIIAVADLGHTELDNSHEYDYDVSYWHFFMKHHLPNTVLWSTRDE